jgi:hypothetical protein
LTQVTKVVDLPVQDGPDARILVGDWGIAAYEVDDRQAILGYCPATSTEVTLGIGATMALHSQLRANRIPSDGIDATDRS